MEIQEKAKKEKVLETGIPFTNWKESWVEREREYQREIAELTAKDVALQHNPPKPERGDGVWIHGSPHMAGLQVGGGGIGWQSPPRTLANKSMASKSLTPLLNKFRLHDMARSVPPTTSTRSQEPL